MLLAHVIKRLCFESLASSRAIEKTPLIEAEENSADNDSNDDKLVEVGGGVKRRLVYLTRKECKSSNVDIGDAIKFLQKNKKRKTEKKGSSSSVII